MVLVQRMSDRETILVCHVQCPSKRLDDTTQSGDISNRLGIGFPIHLGTVELILPQLLALFCFMKHVA